VRHPSLLSFAALGLAIVLSGCAGRAESGNDDPGAAPVPSADDVIGTTPAPSSGDSGGTTPSAAATGSAEYTRPADPVAPSDGTVPAACSTSPARNAAYANPDELRALLVGRWQRCSAPQVPGEEVGVEFTDDHYYPLVRDESGEVIRLPGVDYEYAWNYVPTERGYFIVDSVQTSPPQITEEPRQLRVLFSPVPSKYIPLEE